MKNRIQLAATALAISFAMVSPASALFYGNFTDPAGAVSFLNVQDINGLYGGPLDQFGDPSGPTVSLNSLDFTPINFDQTCSFCNGGTTTDTVSFEIDAVTGQAINTVDVAEFGNYSLNVIGTGFAQVNISALITIDVLEVNGVSVNNVSGAQMINFSFNNGNLITGGFVSGIFTGTGSIDINSILAANGFSAGSEATRILFTMDNILIADHSGLGGSASIRKRDFDATLVTINASQVPEPTTALLLMGGLAALASRRGGN